MDVRLGRLDVRAGRQIIAWGRADGVNPTDNLSGQDLTLLVPDDVDRRLGTTAVRASYYARRRVADRRLAARVPWPRVRAAGAAAGRERRARRRAMARRPVGRARGADRARRGLVRFVLPRTGPGARSRRHGACRTALPPSACRIIACACWAPTWPRTSGGSGCAPRAPTSRPTIAMGAIRSPRTRSSSSWPEPIAPSAAG